MIFSYFQSMKKTKTIYWIITILFAGFMIFTALPDIILSPEAKKFINDLGYPDYFIRFIGVAKLLGSIAILVPGKWRIKEWAYAGLIFDLIAAFYSLVAVYGLRPDQAFIILPLLIGMLSYLYYHKIYDSEQ